MFQRRTLFWRYFNRKKRSETSCNYSGTIATAIGFFELIRKAKSEHASSQHPIFSQEEVKKHGKGAERIWVTYKDGVYDVTDFIPIHPGGDKILLAAGSAIDPFWALYSQHKTKEVLEILEGYRIGRLDVKDVPKVSRITVTAAL